MMYDNLTDKRFIFMKLFSKRYVGKNINLYSLSISKLIFEMYEKKMSCSLISRKQYFGSCIYQQHKQRVNSEHK